MFTIHAFTYETMPGKRSLRVAIAVIILFAVVFIRFIFIVFSPNLIWSRLSGVLVLDFLRALPYQVHIGRFDFSGGQRSW